jgi:drug/metabolite transporter (DMT)-like permease
MRREDARLRVKTWLCATIVILSNAFGDYFMKRGLPEGSGLSTPWEYVLALFQPYVAVGVALLILWQLSRLTLLSWADLSYVLPVTAVGYVVVAFIGKFLLHEEITARRWMGIAFIMAGVALVSIGTAPNTTKPKAKAAE